MQTQHEEDEVDSRPNKAAFQFCRAAHRPAAHAFLAPAACRQAAAIGARVCGGGDDAIPEIVAVEKVS
eukprot:6182238-Pleurochrysis_carterae.AAC.1